MCLSFCLNTCLSCICRVLFYPTIQAGYEYIYLANKLVTDIVTYISLNREEGTWTFQKCLLSIIFFLFVLCIKCATTFSNIKAIFEKNGQNRISVLPMSGNDTPLRLTAHTRWDTPYYPVHISCILQTGNPTGESLFWEDKERVIFAGKLYILPFPDGKRQLKTNRAKNFPASSRRELHGEQSGF